MSRDKPYRKRKIRKVVEMNESEWTMVKARMARGNFNNFADYARHSLINVNFFVVDDKKEIRELTFEISKIGTNINQIAYRLNSGETVSKETIQELKNMLVTIWQYLRYIQFGDPY